MVPYRVLSWVVLVVLLALSVRQLIQVYSGRLRNSRPLLLFNHKIMCEAMVVRGFFKASFGQPK